MHTAIEKLSAFCDEQDLFGVNLEIMSRGIDIQHGLNCVELCEYALQTIDWGGRKKIKTKLEALLDAVKKEEKAKEKGFILILGSGGYNQ